MTEKCLITNMQRFSTNDGPGIRTLVLCVGCNLKCKWCHNPETIPMHNTVFWKSALCVQCGLCIESCPEEAIRPPIPVEEARAEESAYHKIERSKCTDCMKCVEVCDFDALAPVGKMLTVDEVLDEVMRDKLFYKNSGGGLTLGGGEPTMHPKFMLELFQKAKEEGLHICLDTNGTAPWKVYEQTLPFVDFYLVDMKNMDTELHKLGTGAGNEKILENIKKLSEVGAKIIIRVPVMYDYNDTAENFEQMGEFLKGLPNPVHRLDLLPFHNWCQNKYNWMGIYWPLIEEENMDPIECEDFKEILETYGINCTIGG
ncbi:MAG: glycyl-radical enzyme activating protein [Desulfosarcina sp.]|nr:glycyl-radical enzyme activating protein [Desulfobacterales bacterium]